MRSPVRWRDDVGWEYQCPDCRSFWPLDPEFWPQRRMTRCRACANAKDRGYESKRAYSRSYYRANRTRILERQRDYGQAHRDAVLANKRAYYEANAEDIKAKQRARYRTAA